MRLGVNVPNFGPGTDPEVLLRWAQTAEGLGFGLVMVSDHVAVTPDVARRYPAPFYEPFTTLAWLAGATQRIGLGTTVLVMPYRHPLLTARMAANLDRLSGGRLTLGVGVGWAQQEFEALGVPFHRRGAVTDDYLDAVLRLWTQDVADHDGPYVTFAGVQTAPRPLGAGRPALWIGGNSDAALRRAVRVGDAWHPMAFTMPWIAEALPRLAAVAGARPVPAFAPRIKLRLHDRAVAGADRLAGHGTLPQVLDDLHRLGELGATTVVLDTYGGDPAETLEPERAWHSLATIIAEHPGNTA